MTASRLEDGLQRLQVAAVPEELIERWRMLFLCLARYGSAVVAYSGGVDSGLLAYTVHLALGERMMAVTIASPLEPPAQVDRAARFAAEVGLPHTTLVSSPLANPDIVSNAPTRCYYCKRAILQQLHGYAAEHGYAVVVEGQNLDDVGDYRPGRRAVQETNTRSPLLENGLSKAEIRQLARALGLSIWDLPTSPCLATRFPYGEPLEAEALQRVAHAEGFLHDLGFGVVRVRVHRQLARIEVPLSDLPTLLAHREEIVTRLKDIGYHYVSMDLQGYRQGSLNEGLEL